MALSQYTYVWADGLYFGSRVSDDRPCLLALMGGRADGKKELIGMTDGQRKSETTWSSPLLDCKARGLATAPKLATGDGSLGFWIVFGKVFPSKYQQRCWVHKTLNVLDKLPRSEQAAAKRMLHEIRMSAKREDAIKAFDRFIKVYGTKWPLAIACLEDDRAELSSPPNTGGTSAPAIRSRVRLRRCVCEPIAPGPRLAWRRR